MTKLQWKKKKGANTAVPTEKTPVDSPEQEERKTDACEEPQPEQAQEATITEWEEALRTAVAQRDEYLALAQRTQADFANFRRRNQSVRTDAYDEGAREAIAAYLPVLDNLERALATVTPDDDSPLVDGLKMTLKQFKAVAEKLGMEEIPAGQGEVFDPELHNAVLRGEEGEPGTIIDCYEKGYRVKGRVIRYASVKVCAE